MGQLKFLISDSRNSKSGGSNLVANFLSVYPLNAVVRILHPAFKALSASSIEDISPIIPTLRFFGKKIYRLDFKLVELVDDNNEPLDDVLYLAHSPSLGCCGLADKDAYVMVSKSNNPKTKTDYVIELSCFYETKKEIKVVKIRKRSFMKNMITNSLTPK